MKNKAKSGFKQKPKQISNDEEIQKLRDSYETIQCDVVVKFTDFPLSKKTLKGLLESKYTKPTDIQRQTIGSALQGKDVLGAAITGSGKTLAFLIPVLEHLFVNKWSRTDGVGAIIISPTRELAYQIFETLKKIGQHHDFSAGLIIGGKNLKFERRRMDQCNILICTPGRLLQHMDENPLFNASTMEMLVLDEADRCLDMGFEKTLNAIVENFPPDRQTLLFSATQTNTVQDLARLNLREPVYVGYKKDTTTNSNGAMLAIPELLVQSYVVVALEDKITMLWSFIKHHMKQKIIIFMASCKQVKYVFEIFCKLRPGTSLLALYGTLHQDRRIAIYNDFMRKSNVVLFATDVASRGLDFPDVQWVVQLDCPEDVTQYIHRAGRSARNKKRGESLLVLLPSEEEHMVEALNKQQFNVKPIKIDTSRLFSPRAKMEAFLAQFPELKASAQRAFLSYIKSVFLMKNKRIFNVLQLDFDAYAKSLGLAVTPRVRFLERYMKRSQQQQITKKEDANSSDYKDADDNSDDDDDDDVDDNKSASDSDVAIQTNKTQNFKAINTDSESDDDGDDFIKIKRLNHDIQKVDAAIEDDDIVGGSDTTPLIVPKREKPVTKAALAKKAIKKKIQINEKVKFDENGEEIVDGRKQMQSEFARKHELELESANGGIDIELSKKLISAEDKYDKQRFRELVKQRHKLTKQKLKKRAADEENENDEGEAEIGVGLNLANSDDDEDAMSDDAHSVDLSWLPDPDKIYKHKKEAASDDNDSDDNDNDVDDDYRSHTPTDDDYEEDEPVRKKSKVTEKLTLDDAEAIAAQLLANGV